MMLAAAAAHVALLLSAVDGAAPPPANAWVDGPPAPPPSAPLPYPQAPREPGAHVEALDVPPPPPDPVPAPLFTAPGLLDVGGAAFGVAGADARATSARTRAELYAHGALDPDSALVDVPGLWLRHEQAGDTRLLLRGLDDRDLAVDLDGAPLFDLGGLLPPLEQLSNASIARLTLHHGARAVTSSTRGAAGVLSIDTAGDLVDAGEQLALRGVAGAGYGGADLEKGVFAAAETGYGRVRVGLHATLLDREDQRLGRGDVRTGEVPGGVVPRSFGDGGALGARLDVTPSADTHVFTTWQSARSIVTPHPELCDRSDRGGRALDCVTTSERGLDAWIVGADQALSFGGARLVAHGRAHLQHGVDDEARNGSGIAVAERSIDDGVRGGGRLFVDASLPPVALGDVWVPRASLGVDAYRDAFSSHFFSKSTSRRDAEPAGDGVEDPARARLRDGAVVDFRALSASVMADGARTSLWASGRVSNADAAAELGARARLIDALSAWAAATHLQNDDALEVGLAWRAPWLEVEASLWGAARRRSVVDVSAGAVQNASGTLANLGKRADDVAAGAASAYPSASISLRDPTDAPSQAWGAVGDVTLRPGLDGLSASTVLQVVTVDDGVFGGRLTPHDGVPNPAGVIELDYEPSTSLGPRDGAGIRVGFFARSRFTLPQARLSSTEALDRALCPELPSDANLAVGAAQTAECTGAHGSFLVDAGAHVTGGAFRVDAAAENLLDQQGALRDEPLGFGGTAFRVMLTLHLD